MKNKRNIIKKVICFCLLVVILIDCSSTKYYYNFNEINLIEYNNMHLINIVLNGKKAYLLIDTGSSKSLLDISLLLSNLPNP